MRIACCPLLANHFFHVTNLFDWMELIPLQGKTNFRAIYWLRERGLMPGLAFPNELISRDEGLHAEFTCLLYSTLRKTKLTDDAVREMIQGVVTMDRHFTWEALSCDLIGMNSELMTKCIEFVADCLLPALGQPKLSDVTNDGSSPCKGRQLSRHLLAQGAGPHAWTCLPK